MSNICLLHVVVVQQVVSGVLLRKLDDGVKLSTVTLHPVVRGRDDGVGTQNDCCRVFVVVQDDGGGNHSVVVLEHVDHVPVVL